MATLGREQMKRLVDAFGWGDKSIRKLVITFEVNQAVMIDAQCFAEDDQLDALVRQVEVDWKGEGA